MIVEKITSCCVKAALIVVLSANASFASRYYCESDFLNSTEKLIVDFENNFSKMTTTTVGLSYKLKFEYELLGQPYSDVRIYYEPNNGARPIVTFKFTADENFLDITQVNLLSSLTPYVGRCEKI